jgi:hypothetical protein
MSSSTSSSDPWRRFFRFAAGSTVLLAGLVYAFVVTVDPFNTLPLSPPLDRVPVASNQRFSYPALARSQEFDSAIFGTSTSRLLRPAALNQGFGARFVNLAMNDATAYEQWRLFKVFARAHPAPRAVAVGVDVRWCGTGAPAARFTPRPFPAWMYDGSPWRGYAEMFNLYAVQEAGQEAGVLLGLKREFMGRDGYTRFVPPDSEYDPARVAVHLRDATPSIPQGARSGDPAAWRYPELDMLADIVHGLPAATRKILFFPPYYHKLFPPAGTDGARAWNECKRRVAGLARSGPNGVAVDFMLPSPITTADDNYWDPLHYRVEIADRLARDLVAADRGEASQDYRLLAGVDAADPSD